MITNHGSEPLGFLFMRFDTAAEMYDIMIRRYGDIRIHTVT